MLQGIAYCHHHGICHGSFQPQALVVSSSNEVKVMQAGYVRLMKDRPEGMTLTNTMGSASRRSSQSLSGAQLSTALQSPEQILGEPHPLEAYDAWCLGVTLYFLVVGKAPFASASLVEMLRKIQFEDIEIPPEAGLTHDLQDLLRQLLAKDVPDRITVSECVMHPWVTKNERIPLPEPEDDPFVLTDEEIATSISPHLHAASSNLVC
jgi:serine/threonine protein kinase